MKKYIDKKIMAEKYKKIIALIIAMIMTLSLVTFLGNKAFADTESEKNKKVTDTEGISMLDVNAGYLRIVIAKFNGNMVDFGSNISDITPHIDNTNIKKNIKIYDAEEFEKALLNGYFFDTEETDELLTEDNILLDENIEIEENQENTIIPIKEIVTEDSDIIIEDLDDTKNYRVVVEFLDVEGKYNYIPVTNAVEEATENNNLKNMFFGSDGKESSHIITPEDFSYIINGNEAQKTLYFPYYQTGTLEVNYYTSSSEGASIVGNQMVSDIAISSDKNLTTPEKTFDTKNAILPLGYKFSENVDLGAMKTYNMDWENIKAAVEYEVVPMEYYVNFEINIDDIDFVDSPNQMEAFFGSKIVEPKTPTKLGYKFLGWYKDSEFKTLWDFNNNTLEETTTLHGNWKKTHSHLVFNMNGGETGIKTEDLFLRIGYEFDISSIQPGGDSAPKYRNHIFLGWKNTSGEIVKDIVSIAAENKTLTASWVNIEDSIIFESTEPIVAYKDEASLENIESKLKIKSNLKNDSNLEIQYEINEKTLEHGGFTTIKPYILDSYGKKHYANKSVDLYVLNKPFISSSNSQTFKNGEKVSINGLEWSPSVYFETPDFTSKTISRMQKAVTFISGEIDTNKEGVYNPSFVASITDISGNDVEITKKVKAVVLSSTETTDNITGKNKIWYQAIADLEKSSYGRKVSYIEKDYEVSEEKIEKSSIFDSGREFNISVSNSNVMPAEILNALSEKRNAKLSIKSSDITFKFESKNFSEEKAIGMYDLGYEMGYFNEALSNSFSEESSLQIGFNTSKKFPAPAIMEVKLSGAMLDSYKKRQNGLFMFYYNENINELELVGKMSPVSADVVSINVDGLYGDYVILDHLPNYQTSKNSDTLSYWITNKTNPIANDLKIEIERTLNTTIEEISFVKVEVVKK